jgi:segregation and condensation protein B
MPPLHLRSAVEALLFSSDQPLTLAMLADALDAAPESVTEALLALGDEYRARGAGVEVREMAGGWIVTTTAEQHEWVARMLRGKRRMRLSRAALETLAIIAYKQPVTKSEVEAIRGVDSSGTLATLLERSLVTIKGRSTVVGRPLLYGSTPDFLNYFGLRDLSELPRPEELRALVAAREPEQLDMLELDGDGLPLALAAAGTAEPGTPEPAANDDTAAAAFQVASDMPAVSDTEDAADEDEDEYDESDEDEFDDDDDDDDDEDDDDDDDDADGDDPDEKGEDQSSDRRSVTLTERNGR